MSDGVDGRRRVLIVEDEPEIARVLIDYLERSFDTEWLDRGDGVVDHVRANTPDLILLDLMLPGRDGTDICRDIRRFSRVPIIMVTARVEEIDRLLGLELGADDYVCKPFYPREVVARVKRILDRGAIPTEQPPASPLDVDQERYVARLDGSEIDLTPVEFRLLAALARRPGVVLSRDQLMSRIYPDQRVVSDRTIDTHVRNLRNKLQTVRPDEEMIHSVYGVGYRLDLPGP